MFDHPLIVADLQNPISRNLRRALWLKRWRGVRRRAASIQRDVMR